MATRDYHSPVREEKARRTRADILDSLIDLLNERGPAELSIRDLAERAGVGERTVYRYFPDRAALLEGLIVHADHLSDQPEIIEPTSAEELLDAIPRFYASWEHHQRATRAVVLLNLDPARTAEMSRTNRTMIATIVGRSFPTLDRPARARAAATLHLLASSRTWLRFRDEEGLSAEQAAAAAREATRAVLDDLRRAASRS